MKQTLKIGLISGGAIAIVVVTVLILRYIGSSRLPSLMNMTGNSAVSGIDGNYSPPSNFSAGNAAPDISATTLTAPVLTPPSLPDSLR